MSKQKTAAKQLECKVTVGKGIFLCYNNGTLAAHEIKTINGIKVPLMKGLEGKGKTDGGAVAVAAAVSFLGGFLMKGSGIVYEPGTNFMVEVKADTDLQCTPENLAKVMDTTVPRGQEISVSVK